MDDLDVSLPDPDHTDIYHSINCIDCIDLCIDELTPPDLSVSV